MWPKYEHAQSQFWAVKNDLWHPCYSFRHALEHFSMEAEKKKKIHLEMGNIKQTELQRLKKRREKIEQEG